jgi:malonyl CoA-acyl carrier protein transacylase
VITTTQPSVAVTGVAPDLFGNAGLLPWNATPKKFPGEATLRPELLQEALETAVPSLALDRSKTFSFVAGSLARTFCSLTVDESVVMIDTPDGTGALQGIVRAAEALVRKKCEIAVVMTIDAPLSHGNAPQAAALVLQTKSVLTMPQYALLSAGLSRSVVDGEETTGSALLLEACARAQLNPPEVSLLDLYGDDNRCIAETLQGLRSTLARGAQCLPHCTIGPMLPGRRAVEVMRGVCTVVMALYQRLLPALFGNANANTLPGSPFCAASHVRPWLERTPRRAAILSASSKTEAVVLLQEAPAVTHNIPARIDPVWPLELTLVQARDCDELIHRLLDIIRGTAQCPQAFLAELAPTYETPEHLPFRTAIVAESPQRLMEKAHRAIERLTSSDSDSFQTPDGIYFGNCHGARKKTVFVFPGQGSQYLGMLSDVCIQVPKLQRWFEQLQDAFDRYERCPHGLMVAPPEVGLNAKDQNELNRRLVTPTGGGATSFIASLGMHDLLTAAGAHPDAMLGYSNGENAALIASGRWRVANVEQICDIVTQVCRSDVFDATVEQTPRGRSLAVNNAPPKLLSQILDNSKSQLFLALDNCPAQVVLFGDVLAIESAIHQLEKAGAVCSQLPFDRGHHTPMFMPETKTLLSMYATFEFAPGKVPLYSCASTGLFSDDPNEIRALASWQWVRTVRFRETINRLYADGFRCFVEIGPSSQLTSFIHNILRGRTYTAIATNVRHRPGLEQLLKSLGQLFVSGLNIDPSQLKPNAQPQAEFCGV